MNLEITLWILGGVFVCIGSGMAAYIAVVQRLTRLEVSFELWMQNMGNRAAKALHRHDDKYHMDALLDKYLDRNYELNLNEWKSLRDHCLVVENDPSASDKEHVFSAWLGAICEHKMLLDPRSHRKTSNVLA